MNPKQPPPPPLGLTPQEVFYILYRHKWLIIILSSVSIVAGLLVRFLWPLPYESDAALMIKYIQESKPPVQAGTDSQVMNLGREENIINSEIRILNSFDLATNVVGILTSGKILAKEGGGTNRNDAALLILKNLKATVAAKSDVIELSYTHRDPDMATLILGEIIETYLKRHNEIHRPEDNEFLTRETENYQSELRHTESLLLEAKKKANIPDELDDSQKAASAMLSKTQQEIYDAQAEWAGYQQTIRELRQMLPASAGPVIPTNTGSSTAAETQSVPADKVAEYQRICEQLTVLQSEQEKLLLIYTTNNSLVQTNAALIARSENLKQELEGMYRGLINVKPADTRMTPAAAPSALDPEAALRQEVMKADALAVRIRVLTNQLAEIRNGADNMSAMEATIQELQRKKEQDEASLAFYSKKLDENVANAIFNSGNSNISQLEAPMPALRDDVKLNKWMIETMLAGLAIAFGLPFLIELVLDHTLKHPIDVQAKLGLPFFISIPQMNGHTKRRTLKRVKRRALPPSRVREAPAPAPEPAPAVEDAPANPLANGHLALWQDRHSLQPFYEALRDRLMTFFEMINLTHKPKLVAVTSCSPGAGVTSTAAGLASSLSETGDGNVLLVNMNVRDGEAHHFYKGKLTCGLDEVLEKGTRDHAFVQGNLYVAKEQPEDDRLPRVLPKRFSHLLPKMKASDFDYIIFDMPPVSQISITPRLARFMDMVLLVIESGKTDRDMAKRVANVLTESKANVGIVLNKNQAYLPGRHQDI